MEDLEILSTDFNHNEFMPAKYTCESDNINPTLQIKNIPNETKSMTLIVDDPDAPGGTFTHWVVFNIPPDKTLIAKDSVPGIQGKNDFDKTEYMGPCPPSGTHRYMFKLYALSEELDLQEGVSRNEVESAMKDKILADAKLIGKYAKSIK